MSNFDITFCSNLKCENLNCERNQNNLMKYWNSEEGFIEIGNHPISIGEFKKCEYWEVE